MLGEELLRLKFHQVHEVTSPFRCEQWRGFPLGTLDLPGGVARGRVSVVVLTPRLR
jgi:hypothetical protein